MKKLTQQILVFAALTVAATHAILFYMQSIKTARYFQSRVGRTSNSLAPRSRAHLVREEQAFYATHLETRKPFIRRQRIGYK
jgi:hypothetical protein